MSRKIKQIMAEPKGNNLLALCKDGTLWRIAEGGRWQPLPEIPESTADTIFDITEPILYYIEGKRYRRVDFRRGEMGELKLSYDGSCVVRLLEDTVLSVIIVAPF